MKCLLPASKPLRVALCVLLLVCLLAGCGAKEDSSASFAQIIPPASSSEVAQDPVVNPFDKELDFDQLQAENPDYEGWLVVPGTVIDYPVMYCADNSYYLNHDENRAVIQSGALFTDMSNARDFSDPVTLIYGHYMPDDSYFTQLHRYKDQAYFEANRQVLLYTPEENIEYAIVAAFETDDRNLLYQKDYTRQETMQELLDWVAGQRGMEANVDVAEVTTDDKLLVLSTCVQEVGGNGRLLVFAKRLEPTA